LTLTAADRSFSTSVTSDGGLRAQALSTTEVLWSSSSSFAASGCTEVHLCFCHCVGRREKGHMRDGPECEAARWAYRAENKMFASRKTRSTLPRPVVRIFPGHPIYWPDRFSYSSSSTALEKFNFRSDKSQQAWRTRIPSSLSNHSAPCWQKRRTCFTLKRAICQNI